MQKNKSRKSAKKKKLPYVVFQSSLLG